MKIGDLVEQRYETGQYGPNALALVVDVAGDCVTVMWCDDGTTSTINIERLELISESR